MNENGRTADLDSKPGNAGTRLMSKGRSIIEKELNEVTALYMSLMTSVPADIVFRVLWANTPCMWNQSCCPTAMYAIQHVDNCGRKL